MPNDAYQFSSPLLSPEACYNLQRAMLTGSDISLLQPDTEAHLIADVQQVAEAFGDCQGAALPLAFQQRISGHLNAISSTSRPTLTMNITQIDGTFDARLLCSARSSTVSCGVDDGRCARSCPCGWTQSARCPAACPWDEQFRTPAFAASFHLISYLYPAAQLCPGDHATHVTSRLQLLARQKRIVVRWREGLHCQA